MSITLQNFIGGRFVGPQCGEYLDSPEPATGLPLCRVPDSDATDLQAAVEAAKAAFPAWRRTTALERSKILNRIADLIEADLEAFAVAESRDQGKPVSLARTLDIPRACWNFRFFAGAILHHQESATQMDGMAVNYTMRTPVGIAGLISPWNLPLYLLTWKVAPAIAVGNVCICKPSEFTSLTAFKLCEVLVQAGLPPGVVNVVFGTGPRVGQALCEHPDIPLISFTGSTATGERISKAAAPHHKKVSLELGGKNANIVFADANLDEAVPTSVRSSFANQGEICLCGSRIFVQESIAEEFTRRLVAEARKIVVGDPADPRTTMGALVSRPHLDKVESYVRLAREEGGTILLGGDKPEVPAHMRGGYWLNPTIITGLPLSSRCLREEIFGPVVTINTFRTEDEVVAMANATHYGLSASVWTTNIGVANRVAEALDVGTVWINCWMLRDLRVPFGGQRHSGVGREGGEHSIDFYTEVKNVCVKYRS